MISLLSLFDPILRIASAGGPIKTSPSSATRWAKVDDSERKPYPGCMACGQINTSPQRLGIGVRSHFCTGRFRDGEYLVHVELRSAPLGFRDYIALGGRCWSYVIRLVRLLGQPQYLPTLCSSMTPPEGGATYHRDMDTILVRLGVHSDGTDTQAASRPDDATGNLASVSSVDAHRSPTVEAPRGDGPVSDEDLLESGLGLRHGYEVRHNSILSEGCG
jgi:hypothetical protein